eukprot:5205192-Lingulodinium_polyedra.AAC.1
MTAATKDKMPTYIIEDSTQTLGRLSTIEAVWQKVVQGGPAPEEPELQAAACNTYMQTAQEGLRNLQT